MMILSKIRFYIISLPKRIKRLVLHLAFPILRNSRYVNTIHPIGVKGWMYNLFFYLLDVSGIPELIEVFFSIFMWRIRPLTKDEIDLSKTIFGDNINYSVVTVDRFTRIGMKSAVAYVTFNTINYRTELASHIFIHEMVHIWQYQKFGSIYIPHALHAQSHEGYDYGGVMKLYKSMLGGQHITAYNFEQQAEIIEHYFQYRELGLHEEQPLSFQSYTYFKNHLSDFS